MIKRVMKAEVLLTRRCNLDCPECGLKDGEVEELTLDDWLEAFRIVYKELNADFIALYGGEPLLLGRDKLCMMFAALAGYRPKTFTVISNCIGFKRGDAELFQANGCDSWTASVNSIARPSPRDKAGFEFLKKWKAVGGRDACGIITVTPENVEEVPEIIRGLTHHKIWAGVDVIHWPRRGTSFTSREAMKSRFRADVDKRILQRVGAVLYGMAESGDYLIMPTPKIFRMWENLDISCDLKWHCSFPHAVTIDADGSLWACDDFPGKRMRTFSIFDVPARWDDWVRAWYGDTKRCEGCFWSTHVMAEDLAALPQGIEYYQHKTTWAGETLVQE